MTRAVFTNGHRVTTSGKLPLEAVVLDLVLREVSYGVVSTAASTARPSLATF
jgi:hypothetical protein